MLSSVPCKHTSIFCSSGLPPFHGNLIFPSKGSSRKIAAKVNLELQLLLIILHFDCTNFIFCCWRSWRSSIYFAATQSIFTSSKFWFGKQNFRKSITEPRASSSRCKIEMCKRLPFNFQTKCINKTIFRKIVTSCLVITNYT